MPPPTLEQFRVYDVDGRRIIHVPAGRGDELRLHLASHGYEARVSRIAEAPFDRLELENDADTEAVQAILDEWER